MNSASANLSHSLGGQMEVIEAILDFEFVQETMGVQADAFYGLIERTGRCMDKSWATSVILLSGGFDRRK